METSTKQRKSNIELLRILLAFFIILNHLGQGLEELFDINSVTFNRVFTQSLFLGGLANNIFIILTGYLMVNKNTISIKRYLSLYFSFIFYSLLKTVILAFISHEEISFIMVVKSLLPLTFMGGSLSWIGAYLVFYLFIPFINLFIQKIDDNTYRKLLFLMALLWCIIPTFTLGEYQWSFLAQFLFMYMIGGRIRAVNYNNKGIKFYLLISLFSFLFIVGSYFAFDCIGLQNDIFVYGRLYFSSWRKIPMVILSISIFLCFINLNLETNKYINIIGKCSFGIILCHGLFLDYACKILTNYLLIPLFPLWILAFAILLFIMSFIIEYVRQIVFNESFDNLLERIYFKIKNLFNGKIVKKGS